ncbi:unnamed protein product, partial [Mesorhabditis belari]|uniref:Uncharacterized protein n=1 Tax=Mesorhabditis belari TaxID=2138241 RepID=A0AAF3FDV6_9BILA
MENEEVDRTLDATKLLLDALEQDPTLLQDEYFMQKLCYLRDQHRHTTRYLRRARRTLADPKPSTSTDFVDEPPTVKYVASLYENDHLSPKNREAIDDLEYNGNHSKSSEDLWHSQRNRSDENSDVRKRRRNGPIATTSSIYSQRRLDEYGRNLEGKAKSLHDLRSKTDRPKWTPAVTVPQPFSMSEREPKKNSYSTKFLDELRAEKEKKNLEEEEALKMIPKFKAKQPPTTTYVPDNFRVFDEKYIETIRKKTNANLRARQMGMNGRAKSATELSENAPRRARPVPLSTYVSPSPVAELKREKEAHKRAIELLEEAATPNGIKEHETLTHIRGRMRHHDCQAKQDFRIHRSRSVPDFRSIHNRLKEQLESAKRKPTTIPSPFRLSESKTRRHKACSSRSPSTHLTPQPVPAFGDPPIVRPTKAEKLRRSAVKERMHKQYRIKNESREFWESRKEGLEESRRRLATSLGEKSIIDFDTKTEQRRRAQTETGNEYERQLEEMRIRVLARPLIIEQQEALIQKHAMQRKFLQRISDFKKEQIRKARSGRKKDSPKINASRHSSNATFLVEQEENEKEIIEKDSLDRDSSTKQVLEKDQREILVEDRVVEGREEVNLSLQQQVALD